MMQAFLPDMIAKRHGHIVSLSSMAGIVGLQNLVPYCGSKFAVRGLTEAINEEIRMEGLGADQIHHYLSLHGGHWTLQEALHEIQESHEAHQT